MLRLMKKNYTIKELIETLQKFDVNRDVYIANDEELNTIYSGLYFADSEDGSLILAPINTTEIVEEGEYDGSMQQAIDDHERTELNAIIKNNR